MKKIAAIVGLLAALYFYPSMNKWVNRKLADNDTAALFVAMDARISLAPEDEDPFTVELGNGEGVLSAHNVSGTALYEIEQWSQSHGDCEQSSSFKFRFNGELIQWENYTNCPPDKKPVGELVFFGTTPPDGVTRQTAEGGELLISRASESQRKELKQILLDCVRILNGKYKFYPYNSGG